MRSYAVRSNALLALVYNTTALQRFYACCVGYARNNELARLRAISAAPTVDTVPVPARP